MEANRDRQATLVDLLDRVLEKGLVLHADVIITVSGIPLIGLKLSAILASVETMIQYGIWADWDCAIRAAATDEDRRRKTDEQRFLRGEKPVLRLLCSYQQQTGSSGVPWRPGMLYMTGSRLVFLERTSLAILFESEFAHLSGFSLQEGNTERTTIPSLDLILKDGTVISLRSHDVLVLVEKIGREMKQRDLTFTTKEVPKPGKNEVSAPLTRDRGDPRPVQFRDVDLIAVLCNEK
jgi:hypothetical protein